MNLVISQLPSTLARVTITLLAAIDGLRLSLLVVLWSTKTRTTAESGCSSYTAARTTLAVVFSDFCLAAGATICCVNWS